jgi:hypothetical protein
MNPIRLVLTSTMTARSISTDMASPLERTSDPQSMTSRSHTISNPLSSSSLTVSATISSISAVAPLTPRRVTYLLSITSRSRKTFARFTPAPTLRIRPGTLLRNLLHTCRRSGLGQRRTCGRTRLPTCSIPTTSRSTKPAPAKLPAHRRLPSRTRRNKSSAVQS